MNVKQAPQLHVFPRLISSNHLYDQHPTCNINTSSVDVDNSYLAHERYATVPFTLWIS